MRLNNKTHQIIGILILLTLIVAFNSCCKKQKCKCKEEWGEEVEDCTPKHYGPYYLGEVKDYLYFKPGSWWVYENSLSGETDSIYTILCDTAFNEVTGRDERWLTLSYTSIGFRLRSDKYNINYYYEEQPREPDVTDFSYSHSLYRLADSQIRSDLPYNCFTYPFVVNSSHVFQEIIPSLVVKGKTYTGVAVFQTSPDESISLPTLSFIYETAGIAKYYWVKGYGLVQIEQILYRPDTQKTFWHKWELVKCNLVK
jgi:hypothetical protein